MQLVRAASGGWPPPEEILDMRPYPMSRIFFYYFSPPAIKLKPHPNAITKFLYLLRLPLQNMPLHS